MRQGITRNLILSQKRAEDVAQFMISQGVNPSLVSTQRFRDANLAASNDGGGPRPERVSSFTPKASPSRDYLFGRDKFTIVAPQNLVHAD